MNALSRSLYAMSVTIILLGLGTMSVLGQALDCPALFRAAVQAASTTCAGLESNQACLASGSVDFIPAAGYAETGFAQPGDRIDAAAISQITQKSIDAWALTVLRLQLNQPQDSEHTTVMLLLGDVTLTAGEPPQRTPLPADAVREVPSPAPLTAFSVSAQEGLCGDALPNGILLQSPNLTPADDAYLVTELRINGWNLGLGSTAYVQSDALGGVVEVLEHFGFISNDAPGPGAVVEAGQSAEIPRWVGSEDGSIVVTDGLETAQSGIGDYLTELLENPELANRPVEPPNPDLLGAGTNNNPDEPVARPSRPHVFTDGFWYYETGLSSTFGECLMNGFDISGLDGIITLDEVLSFEEDGFLTGYRWTTAGGATLLPLLQITEDVYSALENNPIGSTSIDVEVVTPFVIASTITQTIEGMGGNFCFIETPVLMTSCLVDRFYRRTSGTGLCPASVHEAMGTR